jgi:Leucine-rich repeat (LRR) protein
MGMSESRPGTSGSMGMFESRPGTSGSMGMSESRPGTSGSMGLSESRPGTSGSMGGGFQRPLTAGSDFTVDSDFRFEDGNVFQYDKTAGSRPSTSGHDGREYHDESRPGTSGSMGFFPGRPNTADSDDNFGKRPMTAESDFNFSRPSTAHERPFVNDEFAHGADREEEKDDEEYYYRPGTSETFRRPSTAEANEFGLRPPTNESSVRTRPSTAISRNEVVPREGIRLKKKNRRPQTAVHRDGDEINTAMGGNRSSPKRKARPATGVPVPLPSQSQYRHHDESQRPGGQVAASPVRVRPVTAMVRAKPSRVIDYKMPEKEVPAEAYVRPRTSKKRPPKAARAGSASMAVVSGQPTRRTIKKQLKRAKSASLKIVITNRNKPPPPTLPPPARKTKCVDLRASQSSQRKGAFGKRPYNLTEAQKQLAKEMTAIGKNVKRKAAKLRNVKSLRVTRDPYTVKSAASLYEDITRPLTAASAASESTRPTSPMSPKPRGGKVVPRAVTASIIAQKKREIEEDEDRNPWEINLNSTVPKPRTAAKAIAPPTDAQRRPWVPEGSELPDSYTHPPARPWSTDKTLVKGGVNRGQILLADGRPHTVGSLPRPKKTLSYSEAFAVTRSHQQARKMIEMQHILVKEDHVRMYEDWELDKSDLATSKRDVRSWGTKGPGVTENPVVRAFKSAQSDKKKKRKKRPATVTGAKGQKSERRKMTYKYKDEEIYHHALLESYRTGELEILWKGLKTIPRRIAFNTLFLSMQHLQIVRLSGNKLDNIPSWYFTTLHTTVELNIGNNRLRELPEALGLMHQLVSFSCPQNRIVRFPESFTKLTNLTALKCAGNGISLLPKRIGHLYKLRVMRMEDNNLTTLPGDFQKLNKLSDLCFSRNRIGTLALITPLNPPKKRIDKPEDWQRENMGDLGVLWRNPVTGQCSRFPPKPLEKVEEVDHNAKVDLEALKSTGKVKHETLESAFDGLTNLQKRDKLGEEGRGIYDIRFDPIEGFPFFIHNLTHEKLLEMPYELDDFGRVQNLKRLNLSFNILHHIPKSIGKLIFLLELVLDHNKLTSLPKEIKGMYRLRTLSVVNNRLAAIPPEIVHLTSLERLAVNYNKLDALPPEIADLPKLARLWVSNNFIKEIPAQYYRLTKLTQLYAGDNPWGVPPKKTVQEGIPAILRDCRERWARHRRGGRPPEVDTVSLGILSEVVIPQPRYETTLENAFKSAARSNELRLQWLQLQAVPAEIYEMQNLTNLGLMCNLLTAIPVTLCRKLVNLTDLNMYNNQLLAIPDAISSLKSITSLNFERNKISQISGRLCFLNKLKILRLTGNRVKELPVKLHRLKALQELHLDVNFLTKIPPGIVELPKLRILNFTKNRLKTFPPGIEQLKRLEILNLNQNMLSVFPEGIDNLPKLRELSLSHNRVKVMKLSFGMGALTSTLEKLWLYGNQLIELPHTFRFLTTLKDIRIEHNPMRSPPTELSLEGSSRIRHYLEDRMRRMDEIRDQLNVHQLRFSHKNLAPTAIQVLIKSKYQSALTTCGYMEEEDLLHVDTMVDNYINGKFYNFDRTCPEIIKWIEEKKELRKYEFHKELLNCFLIWVEWAVQEGDGQVSLLTDDIFRDDMARAWGELAQGARLVEPVFSLVTPAIFRKDKWTWETDGLEPPKDTDIGEEEEMFKSIIDRGNDRIARENARLEHKQLLKPTFRFEYVPQFPNSEFQLIEACEMFEGPYGPVAKVESNVKFQLDAEGKARAKVRAKERLEKIREIERKRRHAIKMQNEKAEGLADNAEGEEKKDEDAAPGDDDAAIVPDEEEEDVLLQKNDALVLLQTIYTHEEVDRKFMEERRVNLDTQKARDDVEEWFTLIQGKKMAKAEYKRRKKYGKKRVYTVKKAIRAAAKEVKEAKKEYKYVMERSDAYDANPGAYETHRFNSPMERDKLVEDANMGMNQLNTTLEKYKDNLVEVVLLSKRKKEEIEEELLAELLEKYARLAHEKAIDDGRVYAREKKLRRPWDGRNGRKYKKWLQDQADLIALIGDGGGDDTDSDSSSGETPRDIFGFKKKVDPLETKFVWDKYIDPLEKEIKEEARRAKLARKKAKAERRALAEAAGEEFDESSSESDVDGDDETDDEEEMD